MANFNFNKVILGGRVATDVTLRTTASGKSVTSFTLAINRGGEKKEGKPDADFFKVTAWGSVAEHITRYWRKGMSICVVGKIRNNHWVDEKGIPHDPSEVDADEAYFVDAKSEVKNFGAAQPENAPVWQPLGTDDELPFGIN